MEPAGPRDAVAFLTHKWDPRLARHFAKFRRETERVLPVYLVYHLPEGSALPQGVEPDLVVTNDDVRAQFPAGFAQLASRLPHSLYNQVDLIWLTAFLDPKVREFDRLWLIENDVDYSGNWGDFFAATADYEGDLIATHFRWRHQELTWMWLKDIVDPRDDPGDQLMGFFPVTRLSRRAIEVVAESYRRWEWRGHFELVLPTIVHRAGLSISELGGWNDLTPSERRGRHYQGAFTTGTKGYFTFGVGPAMQHYFAESRLGYWDRDTLYHPIKTNLTGWVALVAWWLKFRDGLRRRISMAFGKVPGTSVTAASVSRRQKT